MESPHICPLISDLGLASAGEEGPGSSEEKFGLAVAVPIVGQCLNDAEWVAADEILEGWSRGDYAGGRDMGNMPPDLGTAPALAGGRVGLLDSEGPGGTVEASAGGACQVWNRVPL